ncbi:MAG: hypothetical protein E7Z93_01225 [Cyanobacteria bacterium SIG32]|nr:hypothetical protein [Cyanobacteria bacterium SIG32]
MLNKKNLLAALAVMCVTFTSVNAADLVQMDINKTTDNEVDVTFHTTEVSSTPMVTRKSDNKYVILMPNVAGQNAGKPDLSAVKDIITNIDIKNVDDGIGGYTKVTFITTKPLNIKTSVKKAAPITQEEKAAKEIIAQVKTHPAQVTPKTEEVKKEVVKTTVKASVAPATPKPKQVPAKPINLKNSPNKIVDIAPPKLDTKAGEKFTEIYDEKMELIEKVAPVVETVAEEEKFDINEVDKIEKISKSAEKSPKKGKSGWTLVVLPLIGLYLLAKMARNSVQKSIALKASFKENLAEQPITQGTYEDIINARELNWQERYKKFVEETNGEVKKHKYSFITTPESESDPLTEIDKKRLELENTLSKMPAIYEQPEIDISDAPVNDVIIDEDFIQEDFKEIKLKSFAKSPSLQTSNRNKVKKALPRTHKVTEGKFIKLQQTPLNASSRRFRNAPLRVADLINTSSQYLQEGNRNFEMMEKEQNYIMSSIDEYFALLDKEQSRNMSNPNRNLSSKVAASLAQVKPSMGMSRPTQPKHISNPIASQKDNKMNGLIVKAGHEIDGNKGFYVVNLDGVSALVGRIDEEIFILKKFNSNVDSLQVRHDNENVYMVKAGGFKSLVDVSETQMGVLIEL